MFIFNKRRIGRISSWLFARIVRGESDAVKVAIEINVDGRKERE